MMMTRRSCVGAGMVGMLMLSAPARAQMHHEHPAPADTTAKHTMHGMDMPGMDMSGMDMSGGEMPMNGVYGPYSMTREASGTAWQPDVAPHRGIHKMSGSWMAMLHGAADLVRDHQGGARGDDQVFSDNMVMGMAQRPLGRGTLGLRSMLSAEPSTIGKDGYPLLLQTGETANGRTPLVDRQHPHDLFMELSGSYSVSSGSRSMFVYAGLPGEPALGPPAFMHRFSGVPFPEAPITHHWLDSTHITFGVLTAGAVFDRVKIEASAFRGREPDEDRYDIEFPKQLDSHSFRVSYNPTDAWSLQVSHGRVESPEQLEPEVNVDRTTASAIHAKAWDGGVWETTFAWGRNRNRPGHLLNALLLESATELHERHTLFLRAERVRKDELFTEPDPLAGRALDVSKVSAGYRFDFWKRGHLSAGVGALASVTQVPTAAERAYGGAPVSTMIFTHVELR
jgi:hypothetical protein